MALKLRGELITARKGQWVVSANIYTSQSGLAGQFMVPAISYFQYLKYSIKLVKLCRANTNRAFSLKSATEAKTNKLEGFSGRSKCLFKFSLPAYLQGPSKVG